MGGSFFLQMTRESAFSKLADPRLLDGLTPPWFRVAVLPFDPLLKVGARIDYRMRWRGLRFRWQSEITDWHPPYRFTYSQTRGPYRFFEHEHLFSEEADGTKITDRIRFRAPGGELFQRAIVGPELERILTYRRGRAIERFGEGGSSRRRPVARPGQPQSRERSP